MSESTEHPKRLWVVDEDDRAGFTVDEIDVTPVHPEQPPQRHASYHVSGQQAWYVVHLDSDAFRTKMEALERAIDMADDVIYEWEEKKQALEDQLGLAAEEADEPDDNAPTP